MPITERLSMVVSLILIGLALYFIIDLPTRVFVVSYLGTSVKLVVSTRLLMGLLLGGLAFSGSGAIIHAYPGKRISYTVPFWVNATLLILLAMLTLARLSAPLLWALALLVSGLLLWLTIFAEYTLIDTQKRNNLAQIWSRAMSYALFLAYTLLIVQSEWTPWFKLAALSVLAGILAASILRANPNRGERRGVYALVVALAIAQLGWVLGFIPVSMMQLSLLLLLAFYALMGISATYIERALSKRVLLEYGVVSIAGAIIVFWAI